MVTVKSPGVVGVPEITPVVSSKLRPAGRAPSATVNVAGSLPRKVGVVKVNGASISGVGMAEGASNSATAAAGSISMTVTESSRRLET